MNGEVVRAYPAGSVFTPTWWTQVARIGLLIGPAVWTALAFWPRGTESGLDVLISDLRAGAVSELQIDEEQAYGGLFAGPWQDRSDEVRVRWRTAPDDAWHNVALLGGFS